MLALFCSLSTLLLNLLVLSRPLFLRLRLVLLSPIITIFPIGGLSTLFNDPRSYFSLLLLPSLITIGASDSWTSLGKTMALAGPLLGLVVSGSSLICLILLTLELKSSKVFLSVGAVSSSIGSFLSVFSGSSIMLSKTLLMSYLASLFCISSPNDSNGLLPCNFFFDDFLTLRYLSCLLGLILILISGPYQYNRLLLTFFGGNSTLC